MLDKSSDSAVGFFSESLVLPRISCHREALGVK